MSIRFINMTQVCERTTMSTATVYIKIKEGTFPRPIQLGQKRSAWVESEVEKWMNERVEERSKIKKD